jgi:hypothetical protein
LAEFHLQLQHVRANLGEHQEPVIGADCLSGSLPEHPELVLAQMSEMSCETESQNGPENACHALAVSGCAQAGEEPSHHGDRHRPFLSQLIGSLE